ncbi:MAG: porin [Betaproteobacteria bacterium]|nr:porin [Betaproteobacteria bacterium]
MALAVAGALAVPATVFAQAKERAAGLEPLGGAATNEMKIYGRVNMGFDNYAATGATAGAAADFKSRARVYDAASRLGFRGTEILGDGLKATFLLESGVNMDTGTQASQSGSTNISTGFLASRIANVSLVFPQGQISFGRTNVWWSNGTIEQIGANYVNTGVSTASGTFGRGMGVGISRVNNLFQYITPVFQGGTYATFSYSPTGEAQKAGQNADGKLLAVSVEGSLSQLDWGVDLAKAYGNTFSAAQPSPAVPAQVNVGGTGVTVPGLAAGALGNVQQTTVGQKLRFGWWYQPRVGKVALIWNKSILNYGGTFGGLASNPDPTAKELTQSSWTLSWEHMFGNIQALAQYGKLANVQGCVTARACDNTNATAYMAGVRYVLSKRTWLYATYNTARNGANYNLDYIPGGITSAAAAVAGTTLSGAGGLPVGSVGADPRVFALGMQHRF